MQVADQSTGHIAFAYRHAICLVIVSRFLFEVLVNFRPIIIQNPLI